MDNLVSLREDMKWLYRNGYGWSHPLTQCMLKQRLNVIKYNVPIDISICNTYLRMSDSRQVSHFCLVTFLYTLYIIYYLE